MMSEKVKVVQVPYLQAIPVISKFYISFLLQNILFKILKRSNIKGKSFHVKGNYHNYGNYQWQVQNLQDGAQTPTVVFCPFLPENYTKLSKIGPRELRAHPLRPLDRPMIIQIVDHYNFMFSLWFRNVPVNS